MLLGAALFALVQAAAPATAPAPQPVTKARIQGEVKAGFDRLDTNKDGYVDKAEGQKGLDGAIANAQKARAQRTAELMARLDTDKNGSLNQAELQAILPAPTRPSGNPYIDANDSNKDGRVSLSEVTARSMVDFDALDKDKNGIVTVQEARAAPSRQRQQQAGR